MKQVIKIREILHPQRSGCYPEGGFNGIDIGDIRVSSLILEFVHENLSGIAGGQAWDKEIKRNRGPDGCEIKKNATHQMTHVVAPLSNCSERAVGGGWSGFARPATTNHKLLPYSFFVVS